MLAGDRGRDPGEVVEAVGTAVDVDHQRLADRLAGIQHLQPGQLVAMLAQQGGSPPQDPAARRPAHPGPGRKRRLGSGNGAIDIALVGMVDLAQRLPCSGIEADEALARARRHPLARDEQRQWLQLHVGLPIAIAHSMRFLDCSFNEKTAQSAGEGEGTNGCRSSAWSRSASGS